MTLARDPKDTEVLVGLVARGLAQIEAGEAGDPAALCAAYPHLAAPVAELLGMQRQLPLLQQAALREDPLAGALLAGRYRLATRLGRGAMGVVCRGDATTHSEPRIVCTNGWVYEATPVRVT